MEGAAAATVIARFFNTELISFSRGVIVVADAGNQGVVGSSVITRHPWVIPSRSLISLTSLRIGGATDGECYSKKTVSQPNLPRRWSTRPLAKANAIEVPVNVAILDDGGNLKAFSRMDGAPILSIEIAQNKRIQRSSDSRRRTSSISSRATLRSLRAFLKQHGWLPTVAACPSKWAERSWVRLGVSGGTVQNDVDCVQAALGVVK